MSLSRWAAAGPTEHSAPPQGTNCGFPAAGRFAQPEADAPNQAPAGQPRTSPPAEFVITTRLVRQLLVEQYPELAHLALRRAGVGWDNEVFRLGSLLAVRIPRRALGAQLLAHELAWLGELAGRLPLPVPEPVAEGLPGLGYPWRWAVVRWVPGRRASHRPIAATGSGAVLAGFLAALHRPAPPDAPVNPHRGVPLREVAAGLEEARTAVPGLWTPRLDRLWQAALAAPQLAGPPRWIHADLHPGNLLTRRGRLVGVIDFGDMAAGDPAVDLAAAWLALPARERGPLREHAATIDPHAWTRARGWAVRQAVLLAANSVDHPDLAAVAAASLAHLESELP